MRQKRETLRSLRRMSAGGGISLILLAAPVAAVAASASSSDGSGWQSPVTWYSCGGAYMGGKLQSTNGDPVYFNGAAVYDADADTQYGRYTKDIRSLTRVAVDAQLGPAINGCADPEDGVHVKVCRNLTDLPDPCGAWSSKMPSPWD